MRSYCLIFILVALTNFAFAQSLTEAKTLRGNWLIGLETSNLIALKKIDVLDDDYFRRRVAPGFGYFAANNLLVGVNVPIGLTSREGTYYSNGTIGRARAYRTNILAKQIGITPYIQQFFGHRRLKPYLGVSYSYLKQELSYNISELSVYLDQKANRSEWTLFTGLTYFLTPHLGLDARLQYGWQSGNYPFFTFPNRAESRYSGSFSYNGQLASIDLGLRFIAGK
jgi:outer membrane protein